MSLAGGPGVVIAGGGLSLPAPYLRVHCQIQPIIAGGVAASKGTYDTNGNYLHVVYEGNLNLGARSNGNQTSVNNSGLNPMPGAAPPLETEAPDFVPNKIITPFDGVTEFTLPFEGTIYLAGGAGNYKFGLQVIDMVDARWYAPQIRYLRRVFHAPDAPSGSFNVPDFHTFIMGTNATDTFLIDPPASAPDGHGTTIFAPGVNMPGVQIIPGSRVTVSPGNPNTTILTGVRF